MQKKCAKEGCNAFVFSNHFCKFHQYMREDSKYMAQKNKIKTYKPTGEREVFDSIWKERKHISFLSGKPLDYFEDTSFYPNLFAHVLEKRKYPELRLEKDNIILLEPTEHLLYDQGTSEQRDKYAHEHNCSWEKLYTLRETLKESYEKNKMGISDNI